MKISLKSKEKKDKVKKKEIKKPKHDQVLTVAQEIKFARLLSVNDKKSRDKVLKTLKKWLLSGFEKKDGPHSSFTMLKCKEEDFIRIWKGLFYGVWLSDKPLVQEDLCENIAGILDLFPTEYLKHALLMYKAGLRVLATQWYGIDHHRMDKFLMLVRRCLRASLRCLLRCQWDLDSCRMYGDTIAGSDGILAVKTPQYARNATSMILHFLDCYLEEISKVSSGSIPGEALCELLRPVCSYVCGGSQPALAAAARRLLTALVRQTPHGLDYQEKTRAWHMMGCPEGGPEALELVSDDEEQDDDEQNEDENISDDRVPALDPRAGRVDVELSPLPVPASLLASMLRGLLATASGRANKRVRICLQRFEELARDEYPLRINTEVSEESPTRGPKPKAVIHSLQMLEKDLVTDSDELALRGLSRKHRKRLLAKSRSGQSLVEELTSATVGKWQVDSTEPETTQLKQDQTDKENKKRKNEEKDSKQHKKRKPNRMNGEVTDKPLKPDKHTNTNKELIKNKIKIVKNKSNRDISEHKKVKKNYINKINIHKQSNHKKQEVNKSNNIIENGVEINNINVKKNKIDRSNLKNEKQFSEKNIQPDNTGKEKNTKNKRIDKTNSVKTVLVTKVKHFQKQTVKTGVSTKMDTPKRVKFVLKNNSMQAPIDYYKSIRQSPNIPFDGTKQPSKTNLKPSTPSPINPFFKKKLKLKY